MIGMREFLLTVPLLDFQHTGSSGPAQPLQQHAPPSWCQSSNYHRLIHAPMTMSSPQNVSLLLLQPLQIERQNPARRQAASDREVILYGPAVLT